MCTGRIPVFRKFPDRPQELLMTKDLLLINAAERHTLATAAARFPATNSQKSLCTLYSEFI
jgi:hypothetical protein